MKKVNGELCLAIQKLLVLMTTTIVVACCVACGGGENSSNTIADYARISVPEEVYQITSDDLDMALRMCLGMADHEEQEIDFDEADLETLRGLFGVDTVDEVKKIAVGQIAEHRIVEYVYEYIMANYSLGQEEEDFCDRYLNDVQLWNQQCAEALDVSYEDYTQEYCGMTSEELEADEREKAKELCIMRHVFDAEGIRITDDEIQDAYDVAADDLGITSDEARKLYPQEEIEYSLAYLKMNEVLIRMYGDVIERACREQEAALGIET